MPVTRANGINIAYEVHGDPAHPALLLIHGLACPLTAWPPALIEALVQAGFRVVLFDNRDIGRSQQLDELGVPNFLVQWLKAKLGLRPTVPYQLDDMARDAEGLLDALKIERAHIVGASMGGMVAQLLAIHAPQRAASLTSISSTTGNRTIPGARMGVLLQSLSQPASDSPEDRLAFEMKTWRLLQSPAYPPHEGELRSYVQSQIDRGLHPAGTERHLLAIIAAPSRVSALRKLSVPTLVIHGDADPLVRVEGGMDTAKAIAGSRLEIIEGMGHDLPAPLHARIVGLIDEHAAANP